MPSMMQRVAVEQIKYAAGLPFRRRMAALERLSEADFWEYQRRRFAHRLKDAREHVPYYRDRADAYQVDLGGDLHTVLRSLPILGKATVREDPGQFLRRPVTPLAATHTTGGTTGSPLRIRAGLYERGITNAILERRNRQVSGRLRPRILRLSGFLDAGRLWADVPGVEVAYLSIYQLSQSHDAEVVAKLREFAPEMIHGYASALVQLALLCERVGFVPSPRPAIVSTSETLFPEQRSVIERALDTQVFNEYGSQEGQHLVLECRARSMHIHPARGIVEVLQFDRDEPAAAGELGRVVVSGLPSREMPLVRYEIGDAAVSTGYRGDCACGLSWPTIGTVYGRVEDLVRTRDGRRVGMLSYSTLRDIVGVREAQIIQTGLGRFTYRIVPEATIDRQLVEKAIEQQLQARLGEPVTVEFEYVDQLERSGAGKLQAVVVAF